MFKLFENWENRETASLTCPTCEQQSNLDEYEIEETTRVDDFIDNIFSDVQEPSDYDKGHKQGSIDDAYNLYRPIAMAVQYNVQDGEAEIHGDQGAQS